MESNKPLLPQEYTSLAECAKKWKIPAAKIKQLCEEDKLEGAAKLGGTWIIPADIEKPVIEIVTESRLSKSVTPKNSVQEAALKHIEDGVPFTVNEHKIGKTTFIVSSVFKRQGPTLEEQIMSLIVRDIEKETGRYIPVKEFQDMRYEMRKNSNAAKTTFDDYIYTYRTRLESYGFSEEDIGVLLEKIAADYEPFEL